MIHSKTLQEPLFYLTEEIRPVNRSNFYLRLSQVVGDWQSLAVPLNAIFSETMGRPTDPIVYLKIFLIGYLENMVFDTDLAERIDDSRAIRTFLGFSLTERTPDHSSIGRVRLQIADCDLEMMLDKVVAKCKDANLVSGEMFAADSTLIPANASLTSLRSITTGKTVREHLKSIREQLALAENVSPPDTEKEGDTSEKPKKPGKPTVSNSDFRSGTDPDARIAQKGNTKRGMYFRINHITDGKGQIILAASATTADGGESEVASPLLAIASERLQNNGLSLGRVTADKNYDDISFLAAIENLGGIPTVNYSTNSSYKPHGVQKYDFIYNPEHNTYTCPGGQLLVYSGKEDSKRRCRYKSDAARCALCPLREKCLEPGAVRRWLSRCYDEEIREQMIERSHSEDVQSAMKARKHTVEPPFGHMKNYGGLSRMSCRGLKNAHVKAIIGAIAYNLVRLVNTITGNKKIAQNAFRTASQRIISAFKERLTRFFRAERSNRAIFCN